MNVTFQLVNHLTRKMTPIRLPSGVTYTPGWEKNAQLSKMLPCLRPIYTRGGGLHATPSEGLCPLCLGRAESHREGASGGCFCVAGAFLSDLKRGEGIAGEFHHTRAAQDKLCSFVFCLEKK